MSVNFLYETKRKKNLFLMKKKKYATKKKSQNRTKNQTHTRTHALLMQNGK